jgi:hypothetical protein
VYLFWRIVGCLQAVGGGGRPLCVKVSEKSAFESIICDDTLSSTATTMHLHNISLTCIWYVAMETHIHIKIPLLILKLVYLSFLPFGKVL